MALDGRLDVAVADDGVEVTFTVTNGGDDPVTLTFTHGFIADVAVRTADREVWRWSDGRAFAQVVRTETLDPGESLVHEATWSDPKSGEYVVTATLEATEADVEARTTVSL